MSHFARIDKDNIVTQVIVAEQDFINSGVVGDSFEWVQTSYNDSLRKNYAGIGHTYDKERDAFITPKPFPSWTLDEDTCTWQAPVKKPEDKQEGPLYRWNEDTLAWEEINIIG